MHDPTKLAWLPPFTYLRDRESERVAICCVTLQYHTGGGWARPKPGFQAPSGVTTGVLVPSQWPCQEEAGAWSKVPQGSRVGRRVPTAARPTCQTDPLPPFCSSQNCCLRPAGSPQLRPRHEHGSHHVQHSVGRLRIPAALAPRDVWHCEGPGAGGPARQAFGVLHSASAARWVLSPIALPTCTPREVFRRAHYEPGSQHSLGRGPHPPVGPRAQPRGWKNCWA